MPSKVLSGIYHANHGRIGNREVFRRSSRITVNTVTFSNFERFVLGQYTLAENCFSRNVMYIPPMRYNIYHANHGRIGSREVFRRSSRITVNTVTFSNFERFVQGQYTLAENCFSRNVMYIPPMSDSSL